MKNLIKFSCIIIVYSVLSILFSTFARAEFIGLNTFNTVNIKGILNKINTTSIKKRLLSLDFIRGKDNYPIYLIIDSPGGSVYYTNSLIDVIHSVKNVKTITYSAGSMASAIVQQTKGKRLIVNNGLIMFHRASGSFSGQFEDGEVEQKLKLWKTIVRNMEQANANRMKISIKRYKELVKDEYWLTSKQAINKNVADHIIIVKCSQKLINKKIKVTQRTRRGLVQYKMSACPSAR